MTSIRPDGRVEFRFFRPNASDVKVLGTFNEWDGNSLILDPEEDGWWSAIVMIEPGEYRFRYWVDGHWYTDFASYGVEMATHGWNSVLLVPLRSRSEISGPEITRPLGQISDAFEYELEMKSAA
jgi:1,4-alpha-glucan branching enzyme